MALHSLFYLLGNRDQHFFSIMTAVCVVNCANSNCEGLCMINGHKVTTKLRTIIRGSHI